MREYRQYTDEICPSCGRGKLYYVKYYCQCTNSRCDYCIKVDKKTDIKDELKKELTSKDLEKMADDFLKSHGY